MNSVLTLRKRCKRDYFIVACSMIFDQEGRLKSPPPTRSEIRQVMLDRLNLDEFSEGLEAALRDEEERILSLTKPWIMDRLRVSLESFERAENQKEFTLSALKQSRSHLAFKLDKRPSFNEAAEYVANELGFENVDEVISPIIRKVLRGDLQNG